MKSRRDKLKELDKKDINKRFVIRHIKYGKLDRHCAIIDKTTKIAYTFYDDADIKSIAMRLNKQPEETKNWLGLKNYEIFIP